jgi:hypothetical protein
MRWGFKRQFLYAISFLIILALLGVAVWFSNFYRAPSCTDGIKNQDELGIDCGGVCLKLCTAPRVSALWARSVIVAPGVYHAVAMVKNPETNAGTVSLPYKFSLYDADNVLIAERSGTMFLYPGDVVPLLEPDIVTGNRVPVRTIVDFGTAVWQHTDPVSNPLRLVTQNLDTASLRLTAHIQNTSALTIPRETLTALLYDANGTLIAASQTKVNALPGHAEKDIFFTWQQAFPGTVVKTDVISRLDPST